MLRMIACDWNGTLLRDTLEETFFLGLCRRAVLRAAGRLRAVRVCRLGILGLRCYAEYRRARRDPESVPRRIARIVQLLNADVFAGLRRRSKPGTR